MKRVVIMGLLCSLSVAAAHSQRDSPRPTDFNFVLFYGLATRVDTFNGTFTRDLDQPNFTETISLKLPEGEMMQVFEELVRIDFWNDAKYPRVFSYPPPTPGERRRSVIPCERFVFTVTSRGQAKELRWEDCFFEPPYAPADELRNVFRTIRRFVESKPEYVSLPASRARPRPP